MAIWRLLRDHRTIYFITIRSLFSMIFILYSFLLKIFTLRINIIDSGSVFKYRDTVSCFCWIPFPGRSFNIG